MIQSNVDGYTRTIGLMGNPVSHTFSPFIHNTLAKYLGISLVYVPFHVEQDGVEQAVKGAYALNILGLNVTVPYKQTVIPFLEGIDESAQKVGAVNTLVRGKNGFIGYNTDFIGVQKALLTNGITIKDKHVVIIGAGGAAYAATAMACENEASQLTIVNRTLSNAEQLVSHMKKYYKQKIDIMSFEEIGKLTGKYIVIQTSSVGLGERGHTPVADSTFFEKADAVMDMIYNPWETKFLDIAKKHNVISINGFDMLVYQAMASFEIWNNIKLDEKLVQVVLNELKGFYAKENVKS